MGSTVILLLTRSFYPDTEALGVILTDLARSVSNEFPITVVCGFPYAAGHEHRRLVSQEYVDLVRILRVKHTVFSKAHPLLRIINWLTYSTMASLVGMTHRAKLVVVSTDPPILPAIALALKRIHGCKVVLSCQELYGDVAVEIGVVKKGMAYEALEAINRRIFGEADLVVVPSPDMADRVCAKGRSRERVVVIPNWADEAAIVPVEREGNEYRRRLGLEGRFTIMYAGNIGLPQDFDALLGGLAALRVHRRRWKFVVAGTGVRRAYVENRVKELGIEANTTIMVHQARANLPALLGAADLHVVPLRKGLAGCVAPSKVYGIMAAGRPYLAISDPECEMAKIAVDDGCGLWASAGDPDAIRTSLEWAIDHPREIEQMGRRARSIAVANFSAKTVLARWHAVLREQYYAA